jgi:hypothetical protein
MTKNIDYEPEKTIIVVGYPKSGNTWLARLLGDALDSPVRGIAKSAEPLATEGLDRAGGFLVSQQHLEPDITLKGNRFIVGAKRANPRSWNGEKIVHIIRDPRDICVSANHYWQLKAISRAVKCVGEGIWPLTTSWQRFIDLWEKTYIPHRTMFYESLSDHPRLSLMFLLGDMTLPVPGVDKLTKVVERQSFKNRVTYIKKHGDKMSHGKDVQLRSMRKGIVGDWKNHFTAKDVELAKKYFDEYLIRLGYIEGEEGWCI